jgi:molecular chaperone DnaK (HSP70)
MSNIINQSRVYEGIIVGYIPAKEKTDRFGRPFTTNPVAFIYPKANSLKLMMCAYREKAMVNCKNPENISAVIPLPGQGERRWTKGNAVITEKDFGKNVTFTVTEPDKKGMPQAINVTIINPEDNLDDDLLWDAEEEARQELAEMAKAKPVEVAPAKVVAPQNEETCSSEMLNEENFEDFEDEEDLDDFEDYFEEFEDSYKQKRKGHGKNHDRRNRRDEEE